MTTAAAIEYKKTRAAIAKLIPEATQLLEAGRSDEEAEWLLALDHPTPIARQTIECAQEIRHGGAEPPPPVQPRRTGISHRARGAKGGRPGKPPAAEVANEYANARLYTADGYKLRHWRDTWYRYHNGWHVTSPREVEKGVTTFLREHPDYFECATPNYVRSVVQNIMAFDLCGLQESVERPCWLSTGASARNWMAFSNGVAVNVWRYAELVGTQQIHNESEYLRPVSPDLFSADYVKYPWAPDVYPGRFVAYLERVQPDSETFAAVRRMLGLLLADTGKFEVFWQLYGHGANGKTVLLDVVEQLLGRASVSRVAVESLAPGTRFQSFPLADAKANISGDIATDLGRTALAAIEGQLKHAVSGGTIEIERKGVDKTEARCRARFVMAGNTLPAFIDRSDAIWRRLRILPFAVQIPEGERDTDLAAKICATDLPGICAWALEGLAEVIAANACADCAAGIAAKAKHRMGIDHERQFLEDHYCECERGRRIPGAQMYEAYKDWMSDSGYRAMGKARFFARVEDVFANVEFAMMEWGNGTRGRGFDGLKERIQEELQ